MNFYLGEATGAASLEVSIGEANDLRIGAVKGAEAGVSKTLRPVGSALESAEDVIANPNLLSGKSPAQVDSALSGRAPGWQVETLGKGSRKDQPAGRSVRWLPVVAMMVFGIYTVGSAVAT